VAQPATCKKGGPVLVVSEKRTLTRRNFLRIAAMSAGAMSLPLQAQGVDAEPARSMYLAFGEPLSRRSVERRIAELGGRTKSPNGARQYAIRVHINPMADKFIKNRDPANEYPIDDAAVLRQLQFVSAMGHPVVLHIFSGKFFRSAMTDYLLKDERNVMRDQNRRPMRPGADDPATGGMDGDTYFAFAPHIARSPKYPNGYTNHYLRLYERNTKRVARLVAEECERDRRLRSLIRIVSVAGEMKYPKFTYAGGGKRWADYGPFAVHAFRNYVRSRIGRGKQFPDFAAYRNKMGIKQGEMPSDGIDGLDPPRGTRRYAWDKLDTRNNPYFMDWASYRVLEIKNHIRTCMRWCQAEGLQLAAPAYYYSHQALFLAPEDYYWRSSTLKTLMIPTAPNPSVSMYGPNTANSNVMTSVRQITRDYGHKGRWYAGEYNPKGPKRRKATDDNKGYPVSEYLDRLHLLESKGCRGIGVMGWRAKEPGALEVPDLSIRTNFMIACKRFLQGG